MSIQDLPGYAPPPGAGTGAIGPRLRGQHHEHARREAHATMRAVQAGTLVERLHALYRQAAAGQLADKDGRRWIGLTDEEAAAYLGTRRSSINAARAPLLKSGQVGKYRRRFCRKTPSRQQVWAWALTSAIERADAGPNRQQP